MIIVGGSTVMGATTMTTTTITMTMGGAIVTHVVGRGTVLQLQFGHVLEVVILKRSQACEHTVEGEWINLVIM
jgi:hypothetical protein